ncbi:hypothetical protein [Neobacillus sp. PS3-34]|uniref:hypothetical protein n=1 Tax=Neobacillus sp. PS3-34 TaxID=3070678 RepID=UPI0035A5FABB
MNMEIDGEETLKINFEMKVKKVHMDPRVKENQGKIALQRGPVVYSFEEIDNPDGIDNILIGRDTQFYNEWNPDLLNGMIMLKVRNAEKEWRAIPYFAWDNRDLGKMRVFVKELIDNTRSVEYKPS